VKQIFSVSIRKAQWGPRPLELLNRPILLPSILVLTAAGLMGCSSGASCGVSASPAPVATTIDKAAQDAFTPDLALARLHEGNTRFVHGGSLRRDYPAQVKATSTGQYPFAVVLSCIDSRSTPEIVFDQASAIYSSRGSRGNYAPTDIIGSIEFATQVAGAKLVVVLGHTECGAIKGRMRRRETR